MTKRPISGQDWLRQSFKSWTRPVNSITELFGKDDDKDEKDEKGKFPFGKSKDKDKDDEKDDDKKKKGKTKDGDECVCDDDDDKEDKKEDGKDEDGDDDEKKPDHSFKRKINTNEARLDEISKKTLGNYVDKAKDSVGMGMYSAGLDIGAGYRDTKKRHAGITLALRRSKGIKKALGRLTKEEAEPIVEVSKKKLGSYLEKARDDRSFMSRVKSRGAVHNTTSPDRIIKNRDRGISRALSRLGESLSEGRKSDETLRAEINAHRRALDYPVIKKGTHRHHLDRHMKRINKHAPYGDDPWAGEEK